MASNQDNFEKPDDGVPAVSLPLSFKQLRVVSQEELTRRMMPVKILREESTELYRVMKDEETGEHYLHYAVFHLNIAGGGIEEEYHHLLPLEHDDVIALALGAPVMEYPQQWNQPYLRNGPHGGFVWYDPAGAAEVDDEQSYAETEAYVREQLLAFRREGSYGEEKIKQLFESMEKRLPPRE